LFGGLGVVFGVVWICPAIIYVVKYILAIRQLILILLSVTCFSHIEGLEHRALIDSNQQHGEDEGTENGQSYEEANEAEKR